MVLNDSVLKDILPYLFDFEQSSTNINNVEKQINPNSIDLTLDKYVMHMKKNKQFVYGESNEDCWETQYYTSDDLILLPNECVLCCTREYIIMPDCLCGQLFTKSTLGRMFVNHMMAGVIDAGFKGRITLEFKNDSHNTVIIPFGSRVVQMIYTKLIDKASEPYYNRNSRYMFATQCEPPKREMNNG